MESFYSIAVGISLIALLFNTDIQYDSAKVWTTNLQRIKQFIEQQKLSL